MFGFYFARLKSWKYWIISYIMVATRLLCTMKIIFVQCNIDERSTKCFVMIIVNNIYELPKIAKNLKILYYLYNILLYLEIFKKR